MHAEAPKKFPFCHIMVMLDYVCVQSFMIIHTKCFMLIVVYKVIYVVIAHGWLLLVTIMLRCHDNGNVGVHVCAEFHDHIYAVLYAHSKV